MSRKSFPPSRYRHSIRRKTARGYLLIEMALVLAISTILLSSQFSQIVAAIDEGDSIGTGKYLIKLQDGINQYVLANEIALKSGNTIAGFANPLQPQIPELVAKNYLDTGFGTRSPLGLVFRNSLVTSGACPGGDDCKVSGFAYSTSGYVDGEGRLRTDILTSAVTHIGPDAGMSYADSPSVLRSMGGATVSNPAGSVAGTLAIRIGAGSGLLPLLGQFYKLDGSRSLAGKMNANDNDIDAVRNLQVTGTTTTLNLAVQGDTKLAATGVPGAACTADTSVRRNANGTGLVICSGGAWQLIGNVVAGIGDGVSCSTPGTLGSNSTGASFVCNGSYWSTVNTTANPGDACAPAGKMATSIATREQLVCKNGSYVKLVNLIARSIEVSRILVNDGQSVPKPNCDVGGSPAYSFHMTQTVVDVSVVPPRQALYIAGVDTGAAWMVQIKLKDNTGAVFTANTYSITAVMKLECSY